MSRPQKKNSRLLQVLRYILFILMLGVFLYSAWNLIDYFLDSRERAAEYNNLASIVESNRATLSTTLPPASGSTDPSAPPDASTEPTQEEGGILPEYAQLYQMNSDLAGWIWIEDTDISYPVMYTPHEPNYYIKRGFNKEYASGGCIYAQEDCSIDPPSDNIILHGHNMRDGSMFGSLKNYLKEDYWKEHKYIRFDSVTQRRTYEVFAVFTTTTTIGQGLQYHKFINAENAEEFDSFVAQCIKASKYDTGIVPLYGDELLYLSTCEYTHVNGRLVVAARRVS